MDYFQVVDSQLRARGPAFVVAELTMAFAMAAVCGFALLHLPRSLVRAPVPTKQPSARPKSVQRNAERSERQKANVSTGARAEQQAPRNEGGSAVPPPAAKTATGQERVAPQTKSTLPPPREETKGGAALLEDVLEDFFDHDRLLDEALLDVTVGVEKVGTPAAHEAGKAVSAHRTTGTGGTDEKCAVGVDKKMARKMMKELRQQPSSKSSLTTEPPTQPEAPVTEVQEKDLDKLLDDFMADEDMLNEAVLDDAVATARGSA